MKTTLTLSHTGKVMQAVTIVLMLFAYTHSANAMPAAALLPPETRCNDGVPLTDEALAGILEMSMDTLKDFKRARSYSNELICSVSAAQLQRSIGKFINPPRPDRPQEWAEFRAMQQRDESGTVKSNGLIHGLAQRKQSASLVQPTAGIAKQGTAVQSAAGISQTGWTALGPGNIGGRVRAAAIHPANPQIIFIGSVSGGIWKTTDGGASWSPVNDFMGNLSVSSIVFDPADASNNTLYAGTGEGFFNGDAVRGAGVFKSIDGGVTWSHLSSTSGSAWYYVNRLAVNSNGVLLAAVGQGSQGIYQSSDHGNTWTLKQSGQYTDVRFDPNDPTKAVAGGGNGSGGLVAYSTNTGATWTTTTISGGGRVELAYAKANSSVVYASVDINSGKIFKSTDGGATWVAYITPAHLGNQGWYDNTIWVDPTDSTHLLVGGLDIYRITGSSPVATKISTWYYSPNSPHADHHIIFSDPGYNGTTNRRVYFGNDGGVQKAEDINTANSAFSNNGWTNLNNGLAITQFYSGAGKASVGGGRIIGGTQDNGSLMTTGGINWTAFYGGDGGYSAVDPADSNYLYGEYVRLQIHRNTTGGTGQSSYIFSGISDAGSSANFIAPFILDPNNANRMLAGGQSLWLSTNVKATTPIWSKLVDRSSAGTNYISAIAVAEGDSTKIWYGTNQGTLAYSNDGTNFTTLILGTPERMVLRILVDKTNPYIVYVSYGGYSVDNLYKLTSADSGATWTKTNITGNLPATPIRGLARHPTNANWLYAGTEVGIFDSTDGGNNWFTVNDGPANVSVEELFWYDDSTLVASTHGRGMFKASVITDPSVKTFTIFNDGSATLNVSSIQKENNSSWLSFSPAPPFSISAGNSQIITVTVDPNLANFGTNTDRLIVYSDDPDENPYPGGVNITLTRTATTYTVTPSAGSGGTISPATAQTVNSGSTTSFTVTPNTGYRISSVTGCGGNLTGNTFTTAVITADCTVTASFTIDTFTVNFASGGNGTLTGTASQTINYGSSATAVTAVPSTGYHFVNWTGTGGFVTTTSNPLTVTSVTAAQTITANFAIDTFAINFASGGNGTLTGTAGQTINYGSSATAVTAVPSTGYHFVNWTGDGGFVTTTTNPLTVSNVTAAQTITANFAIDTFTLTYTAGANGTLTGSSPQTVNYGSNGSAITAVPATGYHFVNWSDASTANPRTDINVTANVTVTANFAIDTFAINFASGGNGTLTGAVSQTINYGDSSTSVTAVPSTGYHFVNWTGTGGFVTTTSNPLTVTNVTAAQTITANFAINTYTLTYTSGGNGALTGTSPQTVNHGSTGSAVTAVPAANYHFVNWSDGLTVNPRTDTNVTGNLTVMANFAIDTHTVTPSAGANGTISPNSPQTINHGSTTGFTITPDSGYHINTVTGCSGTLSGNNYTTGAIIADCIVTAAFVSDDTTPPVFTSSSPASNSYINTSTVGSTLSEAVASGKVTFTQTGGTADPSSPQIYNLAAPDMTAGTHTVNTGLPLVNGAIYTVTFEAADLAGNVATPISGTNVSFDTTTASVTINTPASGSKVNNSSVAYNLSETISSGNIVFTATGGNADAASPHTYTLAGGELSSGTHSVTTGMPLVDGAVYTVSIENVFDLAGNNTASVANTSIIYDSTSVAITNTIPAAGSAIATATVSYTLSEQAQSGKITFTRSGGSTDAGSPHVYTLTGADLYSGDHSVDTGLVLVDGAVYTVSFDATDTAGNPATTVSNAIVLFDNIHDITVTITGNGAVTPTGARGVSHGATRTFTATPDPGYHIASVTGCGGNLTGNSYTTGAITADCAVTASFAIDTFTVTPTAGSGGAITPSTPQTLNYGSTVSFTVTPNTGYHITAVTGCGGTLLNNAYTTAAITAGCSLAATFAIDDTTPPAFTSTAPASNSYINTVTVGYALSEAVASGKVTFTRTGGSADSAIHIYNFTDSDKTVGSHSVNTGLSLINAGIYTVRFEAADLAGNAATVVSNTGVVYDDTSASVVINSPSSNSRTNSVAVSYTLNEEITSGEIVYTWTGGTADGLSPHKYTLAVSDRTSGSHTADTDVTLIDGAIYTVGFENVKDKAGNATASMSNTNITYDLTAVAITNPTPASNGIITKSTVGYTLSEAALSGKVTFTRSGGSADSGSPHVYTLSGSDLYPGSHTVNTNQSLVDGTFYTVTFEATDMAGNAATTVSNAMVFYDSNYGIGPTGNVDNTTYSVKRIDGYDLIKLSIAFGSKPGDANWNPVCDLDKNGTVEGSDLIVLGNHFGEVQ